MPGRTIEGLDEDRRMALAGLGVTTDAGLAAVPGVSLLSLPGMTRSAAEDLIRRARTGEGVEPEDETSRGTTPPDRKAD